MARGSRRSGRSGRDDVSGIDLTRSGRDDTAAGGEPIDLTAVQHDDDLIEAILGHGRVSATSAEEQRLAALLTGWRAEIVDPALPPGPSLDEVAAAVDAELARQQPTHRSGLRLLRPIAGAAAAIAVVMAGVTVFSYNAEPGDPLWKVKEVVFTEHANSTVAGIDTTDNLQEAERLIRSGRPQDAVTVLNSATNRVGAVDDAAKRDQLTAWLGRLIADLQQVAPTLAPALTTTSPTSTTVRTSVSPTPTTLPAVGAPSGSSTPPTPSSEPVVTTLPPSTRPSSTTTPSPGPVTTTASSGPTSEPTPSTEPGSTSPATSSSKASPAPDVQSPSAGPQTG